MANDNHPLELMIRKLSVHAPLSHDDQRAIMALPMTLRSVAAGGYLVRERDKPQVCAVLVSGFAFRQKLTGDGARKILSLHIPGEIIDLQNLFLDESDHNVQTLTSAEIGIIPRGALQELSHRRDAVGHAILVCLLVEASISREWQLNVGRRDARASMAHLFCEMATRLDAQGLLESVSFDFPITQSHLADALGLTPVHVNRTIKSLQRAGYLKSEQRHITIPKWQALREIGDFNAAYLHIRQGTKAAA